VGVAGRFGGQIRREFLGANSELAGRSGGQIPTCDLAFSLSLSAAAEREGNNIKGSKNFPP